MQELVTLTASVFILIVVLCTAKQLGSFYQEDVIRIQHQEWEQENKELLVRVDLLLSE